MNRKLWVSIHLYLAAFFTPMVIVMAISGGLYLFGYKGSMNYEPVAVVDGELEPGPDLEQQVDKALSEAGIETSYEYIKVKGDVFYTRPTSREHYQLKPNPKGIEILRGSPNLQGMMIELHKGHGPGLFKWLEKIFAIGLLIIMLSGLYLGLQSPMLKGKTLVLSGAGLAVFLLLALI